jgi:pilus assembly protein CpaE
MKAVDSNNFPKWHHANRGLSAQILLSSDAMGGTIGIPPLVAGFDLQMTLLDLTSSIPVEHTSLCQAVIVEVRLEEPISVQRLSAFARANPNLPVIAAVRNLSVEHFRVLLPAGAADVISLPLSESEMGVTLGRIQHDLEARPHAVGPKGRLISVVKSVGGVGGTTLATQLAALSAIAEAKEGREVCLLDFDVQFGSSALYLGELPKLTLWNLLEAGIRMDGSMLRAAAAQHRSGLRFVAAPRELVPLEALDADQMTNITDFAQREFDLVVVDLPSSWTNWSVSTLARSDLILLVCDLTLASIHQARRQLDLIDQEGLGGIPLQLVLNRVEKKLFRSVSIKDGIRALGRDVSYTITEDAETIRAALDEGVLVTDINAKSRVSRDIGATASGVRATLEVA